MKKEPNSIASLTLGIIKVFSSSRAQSANATKRSGVQFFPFTSAFNCATTTKTKGKKTGEFLLSRFLKKVHLIYGYPYKHFLSIEKAERLNARLILLLPFKSTFMPKYSLEKNNTNSVFVSGFVLFPNGGTCATLFELLIEF